MWRQVESLGQLLNGSWYSTRAEGECKRPSDIVGIDCWWRIEQQHRNVNASCVSERLVDTVRLHGQRCFSRCGAAAAHNSTSPCFIGCLFATLTTNMTKQQIVAPFETAFTSYDPREGGCPEVPPCPPPCNPPTESGAAVVREPGDSPL